MSDVLVIGGGFAGVWSAAAAARTLKRNGTSDLSVTLVSAGDQLVIRPRLYEAEPEKMQVPLDRILGPIGVNRLKLMVTGIDVDARKVTAVDTAGRARTLGFQRLILASGSRLRRPSLAAGTELVHDVDTMQGAMRLQSHLGRLPEGPGRFSAVVVGAGFTGLEVATELVGRLGAIARAVDGSTPRVTLIERADVVGPDIGPGPRPHIVAALNELGIDVRLGRTVTAVTPSQVNLDDETTVAASTVVWTGGLQASPLTADVPGRRDRSGRLMVDDELRVPEAPAVFAAGDTAAAQLEPGQMVLQSCQHATQLGKHAGHNAANDLLGLPLAKFSAIPYVTCLDLGAAGAVFSTGFERTVELSGEKGKERKRLINQQWIYPPFDDPTAILRAADHQFSRR